MEIPYKEEKPENPSVDRSGLCCVIPFIIVLNWFVAQFIDEIAFPIGFFIALNFFPALCLYAAWEGNL